MKRRSARRKLRRYGPHRPGHPRQSANSEPPKQSRPIKFVEPRLGLDLIPVQLVPSTSKQNQVIVSNKKASTTVTSFWAKSISETFSVTAQFWNLQTDKTPPPEAQQLDFMANLGLKHQFTNVPAKPILPPKRDPKGSEMAMSSRCNISYLPILRLLMSFRDDIICNPEASFFKTELKTSYSGIFPSDQVEETLKEEPVFPTDWSAEFQGPIQRKVWDKERIDRLMKEESNQPVKDSFETTIRKINRCPWTQFAEIVGFEPRREVEVTVERVYYAHCVTCYQCCFYCDGKLYGGCEHLKKFTSKQIRGISPSVEPAIAISAVRRAKEQNIPFVITETVIT